MKKKNGELSATVPQFLNYAKLIGAFSPGGKNDADELFTSSYIMSLKGLRIAPAAFEPGYLDIFSAPDSQRLQEILRLMAEDGIQALWATRGGHGAMRLLDSLEEKWSSFPKDKPIIGYSDITALHLARLAATGVGGWHGPNLTSYCKESFPLEEAPLFGSKAHPWYFQDIAVLRPGAAQGPLLGGNLTLFSHLYGGKYCSPSCGCILMLEDVGEKPYAIDRYLVALRLKGAFEKAAGIVFGQFTDCGNPKEIEEVLKAFSDSLRVPVAMGGPFGHGPINIFWYEGEEGLLELTSGGGKLSFLMR
ncbi:MAG: LD-carboxypeptidase [Deltaproteobacteria bacterium]|jgi:muramoyltetrapeptide carboxypeptidase|nr:LD-carboxypeptidase [Deltaproteobacteria bacterium]